MIKVGQASILLRYSNLSKLVWESIQCAALLPAPLMVDCNFLLKIAFKIDIKLVRQFA